MAINKKTIDSLTQLLGAREAYDAISLAKKQDRIESAWKKRAREAIDEFTRQILENAEKTGRLKFQDVDFLPLLMEHSYEVMKAGIASSATRKPVRSERLAAPAKGVIPRSLKDLRKWWDNYRKNKKIPKRQKEIAEKLKKAYIGKLQSVWERHGEDFRAGKTADKQKAIKNIVKGAEVTYARAKMTIETETTYYFNKARRQVYDESPDVTYYLFMPIRDAATTKWCNSRRGLVYKKGDPLLDKETPPIHWNCRSELLPMTPLNPSHKKIIDDKSRARRNNRPEPLPKGWTGR